MTSHRWPPGSASTACSTPHGRSAAESRSVPPAATPRSRRGHVVDEHLREARRLGELTAPSPQQQHEPVAFELDVTGPPVRQRGPQDLAEAERLTSQDAAAGRSSYSRQGTTTGYPRLGSYTARSSLGDARSRGPLPVCAWVVDAGHANVASVAGERHSHHPQDIRMTNGRFLNGKPPAPGAGNFQCLGDQQASNPGGGSSAHAPTRPAREVNRKGELPPGSARAGCDKLNQRWSTVAGLVKQSRSPARRRPVPPRRAGVGVRGLDLGRQGQKRRLVAGSGGEHHPDGEVRRGPVGR